ncbi:hypothetical protein P170DRAFT_40161 [Aspergillus steynii IBT 23096]|uniref:Uncharacterized protein n=1 Tax=Aspergillus steynii IBT 23096 TaxID=1392250 RepID=A0A2I2GRE6_9EURO|nr:uncharacterized protein P170DRAFT_40161 [Aspergillus steynii IBT 23096]PLB55424.1 hypothetical protein P170DRAFT_40161 [Aspergillus steynii IBT 23096]
MDDGDGEGLVFLAGRGCGPKSPKDGSPSVHNWDCSLFDYFLRHTSGSSSLSLGLLFLAFSFSFSFSSSLWAIFRSLVLFLPLDCIVRTGIPAHAASIGRPCMTVSPPRAPFLLLSSWILAFPFLLDFPVSFDLSARLSIPRPLTSHRLSSLLSAFRPPRLRLDSPLPGDGDLTIPIHAPAQLMESLSF